MSLGSCCSHPHALRVHRFLPRTEAEGPGIRAALWVQGCSIGCNGCFNPETWDAKGGEATTVDEIWQRIQHCQDIEGVTFVGGEPFEQAAPLAELGLRCREAGLSVVTFTGYPYARILKEPRPAWKELLGVTDLLLAGPYLAAKQDFSRPWVGSSNQEFVYLTERYRHLEERLQDISNRLEVEVGSGGVLLMNGQASPETIRGIRESLKAYGIYINQ